MIHANECGIACCGNCKAEILVSCSAGCADPDVELRAHAVASIPAPKNDGHCTYRKCKEPIAPHIGRGRPTTKCVKHLEQGRKWAANNAAKRAIA